MLGGENSAAIDYALLTHFHDDHMGEPTPQSKTGKGGYKLSGITEVGDQIRIKTMLDRGWPDYNYPASLENSTVKNYREFLSWQQKNNGVKVKRLSPGRNDQIVLMREPKKYLNFEVRNIAANGEIWTGVGANTRQYFPRIQDLEQYPSENMCSLALRISYGKFDFFTRWRYPRCTARRCAHLE